MALLSRLKADRPGVTPLAPEATIDLLARYKNGDAEALNRLLSRCLPDLHRFASRRLPLSARGLLDTADLVQESVIKAMRNLEAFESRHQGALQAYLRTAVINRIKDLAAVPLRPQVDVSDNLMDAATSPLERLIGAEKIERFDAAMQRLRATDREAIHGRIELDYSYAQLAVALGKPTAEAARAAVNRALERLCEEMRRGA